MISDYALQKIAELHALGRTPKQILGALHKDRKVSGEHGVRVEINIRMIKALLPKEAKPQVDDTRRTKFTNKYSVRKK
ncbi:unnamed protein product [marine sediment metagenome]|uniref:Uncharacterized protein n=1 Tax=marine sediment metagenome TaxID=412755 RepID=X0YJ27_9ZZZZ